MADAAQANVEIVRLTRLERMMRDLERVSRLGTATFTGLALMQFVMAAFIAAGFDAGLSTFGDFNSGVALRQVLIGAVLWIAVTIVITLALNSGPRAVVALFAMMMAVFWLLQLLLSYASAAGAVGVLQAAYDSGNWGVWAMPFFGLTLGTLEVLVVLACVITLTLFISTETLWACVRGIWASLSAPSETIRTLRGLRGLGPFSFSGLLAAFDLPLVIRERRGTVGKMVAFLAILIATAGITFWLMAPLNVVVMLVGTAQFDCEGGNPTDAQMGVCLLASAGPLGQFMLFGLVVVVAACVLAALLMALAKRLLAGQLERETGEPPIVFLRSFADDQSRVRVSWRGPLDFLLDLGRSPDSIDQILVYEFGRYGPVKALGKPGERRAPFGAQRIYADHAEWQQKISALIDGAHATVLVVDRSAGLRWELEQTLRRPDWLARTLLLLPSADDFARLREVLNGSLEQPVLRRGERVVAAAPSGNGWRLYVSRRPTRFTYQTLARMYFASRK